MTSTITKRRRLNISRADPYRRGFTLVEMLLVLVLLVTIGAVAWPTIRRAYESTYLKKAAEQVETEFTKARVRAMTSGVTQLFQVQANTGQYILQTSPDDSESDDTGSAGNSTGTAAQRQLPEGIIFSGIQRTSDARGMASDSSLANAGQSSDSPPVMFYPDGTTSEATVTIANANRRMISISLRGVTGLARIGDISTGGGTTP